MRCSIYCMDELTEINYRDHKGRFIVGNKAGSVAHNPMCRSVWTLKQALLNAVTPDEITSITRRLLDLCRDPDGKTALQAIALLFDRLLGRPKESVELEVSKPQPAVDWSRLTTEELITITAIMSRADLPIHATTD
jgi:hypothetical protein